MHNNLQKQTNGLLSQFKEKLFQFISIIKSSLSLWDEPGPLNEYWIRYSRHVCNSIFANCCYYCWKFSEIISEICHYGFEIVLDFSTLNFVTFLDHLRLTSQMLTWRQHARKMTSVELLFQGEINAFRHV